MMRKPDLQEVARRLRRDATPAERTLWRALRGNALSVAFRRQHPIPPYVVDFACIDARLVIEVDGGQHGSEIDAERDAVLESAGRRVLRYWNNEVTENSEGVLQDILRVLADRPRR